MEASDLELYTTTELIEELLRRPTFLGVVVHSEEEFKNGAWNGERIFKVRFNANMDAGQAHRLLETVASRLDRDPT
jgi:hypothetical protein